MTENKKLHSLRLLVLLLVGTSLAVFTVILLFIFHTSMPRMLLQAESDYLTRQSEVTAGIFKSASRHTYLMAEDMAIWNETVRFAEGENPGFIRDNWPDGSLLQSYRFNFIVIKDAQDNDLYVEFRDYLHNKPLPVPAGFSRSLNRLADEVLQKYAEPRNTPPPLKKLGREGILFVDGTPYHVAAVPILPLRDSHRPAGTIFLGSVLDNAHFRELTHYTTSTFALRQAEDAGAQTAPSISRESPELVSTTLRLRDIDGNPVLLHMSDTRAIYAEGRSLLARTTLLLVLAMGLFAAALGLIVLRLILRPIERLSRDIGNVAAAGEIDPGKYTSSREFVALCTSINDMLHRISQSKVSMDVLLSILNGMDAYLYVSDPETDEILFINDKMAAHYGIRANAVGSICWKVLQAGMTERCDFCPNYRLAKDPEATIVWEEHSTATGHYYRNTDCLIEWIGKRKVHLQHSVDITDTKTAEAALQRRLEQQELMSALSQNFISTADMPELIAKALRMAGAFMDVSETLLIRHHGAARTLEAEYVWRNESQNFSPQEYSPLPFHEGSLAYEAFVTGEKPYLAYSDISGMPEMERVAQYGVRAFIGVPVCVSGALWGLLSFVERRHPRAWSESDIQLIRMIGSVIAGAIERNLMEERLVRMSSIIDSTPHYVSYVNERGEFEYLNPGALRITGYNAEELAAGGMATILDAESYALSMHELFPRVLAEGKTEFELPIVRKDGQRRILSFSAFKTDFKAVGVGAIASDITEKRLLEQELIAAKEQAEQSSRAKGEFLSRMSHEMRTPMNAIIGMTSIAKGSRDPEKKEYCLDKISEASNHLLGVINDILDMSKIEANKFELSPTEFDLERMLMRVVNVINFRVDEKHQTLIINLDDAVPRAIVADEQRLAQVIANLLSNAVKFTPEHGNITLAIRKLGEEDGLCLLKFEVIDTGIGVSREQQAKLFHSFEQADGSISRKFGGTGLGLAISRNIVELMGGAIGVESEDGRGANFSFTIKARRGSNLPQSRNINWRNLRILVVDDAPEVREYFLNFAQSVGIDCVAVASGDEACKLLEDGNNVFNIVFVDWRMPGMDGIELSRRIKRRRGENIVVIMISAAIWSDIEHEAREAGVDRFIPKPLFPSLLVDCINASLGLQGSGTAEASEEEKDAARFAGHRILLAEDVDINREIVVSLLQHTGIVIDCAENGLQAYAMFRDNPSLYEMIFMDIHMPEVDGYEATRRIRALDLPEARAIPIVAMTANVFREDIEKCLEAGMNDHVGKPVNVEEIIGKLQKYLPDG